MILFHNHFPLNCGYSKDFSMRDSLTLHCTEEGKRWEKAGRKEVTQCSVEAIPFSCSHSQRKCFQTWDFRRLFLEIVFIRVEKKLLESCSKFVNKCISSDSLGPESLIRGKENFLPWWLAPTCGHGARLCLWAPALPFCWGNPTGQGFYKPIAQGRRE